MGGKNEEAVQGVGGAGWEERKGVEMTPKEELVEIIRKELLHEDTFSDLEEMGSPRNAKLEGMLSATAILLADAILDWHENRLEPLRRVWERYPMSEMLEGERSWIIMKAIRKVRGMRG